MIQKPTVQLLVMVDRLYVPKWEDENGVARPTQQKDAPFIDLFTNSSDASTINSTEIPSRYRNYVLG